MALTTSTTTTSGSSTDKSISIVHYNSTNALYTIYYTVPEGRKFKGVIWVNAVNYDLGKLPGHTNSAGHILPGGTQGTSHFYIEAAAGDFISGSSDYAYHSVVGIETDA